MPSSGQPTQVLALQGEELRGSCKRCSAPRQTHPILSILTVTPKQGNRLLPHLSIPICQGSTHLSHLEAQAALLLSAHQQPG